MTREQITKIWGNDLEKEEYSTNLSPYRLGNVFYHEEYGNMAFLYCNEGYCFLARREEGYPDDILEGSELVSFRNNAKVSLKGITLEFLSELAREKGETFEYVSSDNADRIRIWYGDEIITYRQDPNETLGAFCLRIARERNYLT